jgi:hypothetical protein
MRLRIGFGMIAKVCKNGFVHAGVIELAAASGTALFDRTRKDKAAKRWAPDGFASCGPDLGNPVLKT